MQYSLASFKLARHMKQHKRVLTTGLGSKLEQLLSP